MCLASDLPSLTADSLLWFWAAQGNSQLVVQLAGLTQNGVPDGGVFLGTGLVQCAFSSNLRRVFSSLGPVQFTAAAGKASAAVTTADTQLTPGGAGRGLGHVRADGPDGAGAD